VPETPMHHLVSHIYSDPAKQVSTDQIWF